MNDYKSVQDLIVKAAIYDGVSTTISAEEIIGSRNIIKIVFSRDGRYSVAHIDMQHNHEDMTLYICKSALHELLWMPYDKIEYNKENNDD